jgi:membrane protein DedA with SNARE-associated domain/rhodanese-related sulfurtransferase
MFQISPDSLAAYGLPTVISLVLIEEIGLPIPSFPILVLAGAMAAEGRISLLALALGVLLAALIPNLIWYRLGIQYGRQILGTLCKISLSPDVCVRQTEDVFQSWGPAAVVMSKFIPGLSLLAPPLAGALGFSWSRFLILDLLGAAAYFGSAIVLGYAFHTSVEEVIHEISHAGGKVAALALLALGALVLWKWMKRKAMNEGADLPRITMEELKELISSQKPHVIVDARSSIAQQLGKIPGSIPAQVDGNGEELAHLSKETDVIVYCSCPNEVSAAKLAKILIAQGFSRARPLRGGLEAWEQAGFDVVEQGT